MTDLSRLEYSVWFATTLNNLKTNIFVRLKLKTCRRWWMIGKSGERGSGISVLAARHDDDDDENYFWDKAIPNNAEFTFMEKNSEKKNSFGFFQKTFILVIEWSSLKTSNFLERTFFKTIFKFEIEKSSEPLNKKVLLIFDKNWKGEYLTKVSRTFNEKTYKK